MLQRQLRRDILFYMPGVINVGAEKVGHFLYSFSSNQSHLYLVLVTKLSFLLGQCSTMGKKKSSKPQKSFSFKTVCHFIAQTNLELTLEFKFALNLCKILLPQPQNAGVPGVSIHIQFCKVKVTLLRLKRPHTIYSPCILVFNLSKETKEYTL